MYYIFFNLIEDPYENHLCMIIGWQLFVLHTPLILIHNMLKPENKPER